MNKDYELVQPENLASPHDEYHEYPEVQYTTEPADTPGLARHTSDGADGVPLMSSPSRQMLSPETSYDSYIYGGKRRTSVGVTGMN